ncbi:nuclear transport factor 2 family protein [Alteromonadaceae bacterium BrNp21-10]|nr:nuclear transport factor 2 family protein [Alteromonadaceae bacterium BrNp21-10]
MLSENAQRFIHLYQNLNKDNLSLLKDIYHPDIHFTDPLHSINGLDALTAYFTKLYSNVSEVSFVIEDSMEHAECVGIYWNMQFSHPALRKGLPITVCGHSRLKFKNDVVIFHQDYFDTNNMLFEHVPLLGRLIRMLKRRASQ